MNLRDFVQLSRIEHGLFVGIVPVASYVLSSSNVDLAAALALYFSTLLASIYLFVTNDLFNIVEDRVNRPWAPIPSGRVSAGEAWTVAVISIALGTAVVTLGLLERWLTVFAALVYVISVALGSLYNITLKRKYILNNIVLSTTTSFSFIYGLLASTRMENADIVLMFFTSSLLATLGREVVKGVIDIKGDLLADVKTVAIVRGPLSAIRLSVYLTTSSIIVIALASALAIIRDLRTGVVLCAGTCLTSGLVLASMIKVIRLREVYADGFRRDLLRAMFLAITFYLVYSISHLIHLPLHLLALSSLLPTIFVPLTR